MSDAGRAYNHYRWAERYSRHGKDEKAQAHMRRALHYGRSSFGTLKRHGDGSDINEGGSDSEKKPRVVGEIHDALVASYRLSTPANRLGFIRGLCNENFRKFFYDKPRDHNRISRVQKDRFKSKIAELKIGDASDKESITRCLTSLVDQLTIVPFGEFCTALARCVVRFCIEANRLRKLGNKIKLLVAVGNVDTSGTYKPSKSWGDATTKKSNEWVPLLLFTLLMAAIDPPSAISELMAARYPDALKVLTDSRSDLDFPDDVALYYEQDRVSPVDGIVNDSDILVVCDDASYSGTQAEQNAKNLRLRRVSAPMLFVIPFASEEALRKIREANEVSVINEGRIEMFSNPDAIKCDEILKKYSKAFYKVMYNKATTGFQHKIADYFSFYPHLILGSLDGKSYLLESGNKTLLSDCTNDDPVPPYDDAMEDSCLFAFYKVTMKGMDYTGYLDPAKLQAYSYPPA